MKSIFHIKGCPCPDNRPWHHSLDKVPYLKHVIAMKLIVLLSLAFSLQLSAKVSGQQISLDVKEAPMERVMMDIYRQSGYAFIFNDKDLAKAHAVTARLDAVDLETALQQIFAGQPFEYKIADKTITIKRKTKITKKVPLLQDTIRGTVTDSLGQPLAGVAVRIVGTNRGTTTNSQGRFQFNEIPENATLSFHLLGYGDVQVAAESNLNITLRAIAGELDVVNVSTGYQNIPKERATGSFAQPIKEMFDNRVSTDVLSRLEGITSGLVFNSPGVTGQRAPKLSIRGRSTIYANDDPLIVVDNFPYDGDISNINPNDIEDVTILKDAAAASIWGVQAGNGVIVITTKKGRLQQPVQIQFNANATVGSRPNLFYDPNYLDASSFIDLEYHLFREGKYDGDIDQNNPNVNTSTYAPLSPVVVLLNQVRNGPLLQAEADAQINALRGIDLRDDLSQYVYRRSVNQQYNLNLSGGGERNSYYFSAGYDKNLESTVGNGYERITLDGSNTFSPVKNLDITLGLNYVQNNSETQNTSAQLLTGGSYDVLPPYTQLADENGNALQVLKNYSNEFVNNATDRGFLDWRFFPLEELRNSYDVTNNTVTDARITGGLRYTFIPGLSAEAKYQYQRSGTNGRTLATEDSYLARNSINRYASVNTNGNVTGFNWPVGGILNGSVSNQNSHRFRGYLNFDKQFGEHAITAIAGYEIAEVKTESNSYMLHGYNDDLGTFQVINPTANYRLNPGGASGGSIPTGLGASGTLDRFRTYFANAAYTFRERYTVSASGRIDASNYFGVNTNQRAVPLWSTGFKWDADKESFYQLDWLPKLSLRASYGYQGNLDRRLAAVTTFMYSNWANWTNARFAQVSNYGNPELRWEKTRMTNLGIDFALRNQIISGSIEYFGKRGIDLIGFTQFAPSTGITNMQGNYAATRGQGIDVQLTSRNLNRDLKWNTSYIFSWARDQVTEYTGTNITFSGLPGTGQVISPVEGYPVYAIYGLRWAGLDPGTGAPLGYDADGNSSNNYGRLVNPISMDELVYFGNARPVYFGGINNRFSYKGFSLAFNISYKLGYYFRRSSINYNLLVNRWRGHSEYASRWQNPGDEAHTTVPSLAYPVNNNRDNFYNRSEVLVERGDHLRLQDISLSYDLGNPALGRLPFSHVQVYLYANNLGILWRKNDLGIDPDFPRGGIPTPRTISFGLKASL